MIDDLYLSPHLDDVAFSASRHLIRQSAAGRRCGVATVFTATVADPSEFALACQLDKGLDRSVDYMSLRREEDRRFVATLNDAIDPLHPIQYMHGDLPEAPHRGYTCPADLFASIRPEDRIAGSIDQLIDRWVAELRPQTIVMPSGFGQHVDHRQVIEAMQRYSVNPRSGDPTIRWYRDSPYVTRNPDSPAIVDTSNIAFEPVQSSELDDEFVDKLAADACERYVTQVPFQFGSGAALQRWFRTHPELVGRRLAETGDQGSIQKNSSNEENRSAPHVQPPLPRPVSGPIDS